MLVSNWYWHLIPGALLPSLSSAAFTTLCCLVLHLMVYAQTAANPAPDGYPIPDSGAAGAVLHGRFHSPALQLASLATRVEGKGRHTDQ